MVNELQLIITIPLVLIVFRLMVCLAFTEWNNEYVIPGHKNFREQMYVAYYKPEYTVLGFGFNLFKSSIYLGFKQRKELKQLQ